MKVYCPNCVELLKVNHKKLGDKTVWLICPCCGYRTREMIEFFYNEKQLEEFESDIRRINTKWRDENE